jgi:hypothetical protein
MFVPQVIYQVAILISDRERKLRDPANRDGHHGLTLQRLRLYLDHVVVLRIAAAAGYVEAVQPDTAPEDKARIEAELLEYCRVDTEAMAEIVKYFKEADA